MICGFGFFTHCFLSIGCAGWCPPGMCVIGVGARMRGYALWLMQALMEDIDLVYESSLLRVLQNIT